MPRMDDAWVRVKRAQVNLKRLKDEMAVFRDTHQRAYAVGAEYDRKGNVRLVARIGQRPPKEWGLASGDILVDLRLDTGELAGRDREGESVHACHQPRDELLEAGNSEGWPSVPSSVRGRHANRSPEHAPRLNR